LAADEAVVLLHLVVAGFVALGFAGHGGILTRTCISEFEVKRPTSRK
jgi:hypothetical protein